MINFYPHITISISSSRTSSSPHTHIPILAPMSWGGGVIKQEGEGPESRSAKAYLIAQLCQAEESLMAHSLPSQAWRSADASAAQLPSSAWGMPSPPPASSTRTAATWARSHRFCGNWEQSFNPGGSSSACWMGPRHPPSPCPTSIARGPFSPAVCSGATVCRSWTRLSCRQAVSP